MRLLYVIDSLAPGGAETSLAEMASPLVDLGIELHVLPLKRRLDLAPRLVNAGAFIHADKEATSRALRVRLVQKVAARVAPDLIHTTLFEADVAGRVGARLSGTPVSSSIVGDSYGPGHYAQHGFTRVSLARLIDTATARVVSRFHTNSYALAQTVPARIRVPVSRVEVIPRGRNPDTFRPRTEQRRRSARASLGLARDDAVVLAVGRLDPVKGLDHLMRAMSQIAPSRPEATLLLAGKPGAASAQLNQLARSLKLNVRFLGHRDDVAELLAAADVLCLPSLREGFPGAALEAIAVGCPVIASDIPATREVLGPEYPASSFAPVGDVAALAAAIESQLANPSASSAAIRYGQIRFQKEYTITAVARRMLTFFDSAAQ